MGTFFLENSSEALVMLFFLFTFAELFHQIRDLHTLYLSEYEVTIYNFPYYINKGMTHLLISNSIFPETRLLAFVTSSASNADK